MNYHHLSAHERDRLAILHGQGKSLRCISQLLKRSASTLSRELKRNKKKRRWGKRIYYPHTAQKKAERRLHRSHLRFRLKNVALRQEIHRRLEQKWSPELIAGWLKRNRKDLPPISTEAIYQWIYYRRPDLAKYLARSHRKRYPRTNPLKRRLRIPGRIAVSQRPVEIENRQEAGHWETDLVICRGGGALQVSVERRTRFSQLRKVAHRTASVCRAGLTRMLEPIPATLRRSITYDNGSENFEHQVLNEDFDLVSYFCEPYHSWEKGTVENTNGLIRRFIPKWASLADWPDEAIRQVEDWLNDRPRKILQYQTPREAFQALVALTS